MVGPTWKFLTEYINVYKYLELYKYNSFVIFTFSSLYFAELKIMFQKNFFNFMDELLVHVSGR